MNFKDRKRFYKNTKGSKSIIDGSNTRDYHQRGLLTILEYLRELLKIMLSINL